jgi:hypothetical protein
VARDDGLLSHLFRLEANRKYVQARKRCSGPGRRSTVCSAQLGTSPAALKVRYARLRAVWFRNLGSCRRTDFGANRHPGQLAIEGRSAMTEHGAPPSDMPHMRSRRNKSSSRKAPPSLADLQTQRTIVNEARSQAQQAVLYTVRRIFGRAVEIRRPDFTYDVEPGPGMAAARALEVATRRLTRGYIKAAREGGMSWHEIGGNLNLKGGGAVDDAGDILAKAAFRYAAGDPGTESGRRHGHSFIWRCPACAGLISDRGPISDPMDDEPGHAEGCTRLAAEMAAWEVSWAELSPELYADLALARQRSQVQYIDAESQKHYARNTSRRPAGQTRHRNPASRSS